MKNDLTHFEKGLIRSINFMNDTKYTFLNLMEWSTSEDKIKKDLQKGEKIYKADGVYVAIKLEA